MPQTDNIFIADDYRSDSGEVFRELPGLEPAGRFEVAKPGDRSVILRESEFERKLKEQYNLGFQKGVSGKEQFRESTVNNLVSVMRNVDREVRSVVEELERELLNLSLEIAEQIVKKEIETDPSAVIAGQIRSCLEYVEDRLPILIRIHPGDREAAESVLSESDLQLPDRFRLVDDRAVNRGGCIMRMDRGSLRAVISEQLDKIGETLRSEYERTAEE